MASLTYMFSLNFTRYLAMRWAKFRAMMSSFN